MKNASTITAFIISFLVVGSLALVFLFLGNREEEPAPAEPAAQTEVPPRQTVTPQPTVDPLTKEDISRRRPRRPPWSTSAPPRRWRRRLPRLFRTGTRTP